MFLHEHIDLFRKIKSKDVLKDIRREHGLMGFSMACRCAGISRGAGKRLLGMYDDSGAIAQIAAKECGYKTTKQMK
ncbi:MAG: hypothetical protein A4E56_01887 [Pelotomaculum sp. PtaU1.Bin065]|nr:MAG: hypothetical protein A4E56_01887 [Pelotomaculum sp. PtaU1.Bin065]